MKMQREVLTEALNATGVAWKWGGSMSHFNVFPSHNFKPWTTNEREILNKAIASLPPYTWGDAAGSQETFHITHVVCLPYGKYFTTKHIEELKGFRIYTKQVLNEKSLDNEASVV